MKHMISVLALAGMLGACSKPAEEVKVVEPAPAVQAPETGAVDAEQARIAAAVAELPGIYAEGSYVRGKSLYRRCQSCHTLGEGQGNRVGPNLYGVFGRPVASLDSFNYSRALSAKDWVWTPELVDEWLANPRSFVPGSNMSFPGLAKADDRRDVLTYVLIETAPAETPAEP